MSAKRSQSSQALAATRAPAERSLRPFARAGLAHLTEHMLFEGSLHYPEPGDFRWVNPASARNSSLRALSSPALRVLTSTRPFDCAAPALTTASTQE